MKYLLDTNVISELVALYPNPRVVDWIDQLDPDASYLSVITIGEIRKGIAKLSSSKRREALQAWLNDELLVRFQGHIVEITTDIMLTWGELAGRLEKEGKQMAAIDSMIAASVLQGKYTLVTRNTHDFQHADVAMINPWS